VATAIEVRNGGFHLCPQDSHSWISGVGRSWAADEMKPRMVLICGICQWRAPGNLVMGLVAAHFETEPDHDPEDIKLTMVGWCPRCDRELTLDRIEEGLMRTIHYVCPQCHGSGFVCQRAGGRDE